jgi:hypothetical protein
MQEVTITTREEVSRLRAEWSRACEVWDVARCADWTPAKAASVDAALDVVGRAKRAYDDARIAYWAQQQGAR